MSGKGMMDKIPEGIISILDDARSSLSLFTKPSFSLFAENGEPILMLSAEIKKNDLINGVTIIYDHPEKVVKIEASTINPHTMKEEEVLVKKTTDASDIKEVKKSVSELLRLVRITRFLR